MTHDDQATAMRALSGLEQGDFQPFDEWLSDDVTWTITGDTPWSKTYEGKPAVRRMLRSLQGRLDAPFRMQLKRSIAAGDMLVIEARGENRLLDGRRYDNTYCWVCRLEGGRLRELTEYMDTALVLRSFGSSDR
ncbi:MAG: nuclear transport factor 2 family protein [Polyangiaceae bacterium]|nr:nuclear transport factor 2 family protein [Polyangiaceae bacterium]